MLIVFSNKIMYEYDHFLAILQLTTKLIADILKDTKDCWMAVTCLDISYKSAAARGTECRQPMAAVIHILALRSAVLWLIANARPPAYAVAYLLVSLPQIELAITSQT